MRKHLRPVTEQWRWLGGAARRADLAQLEEGTLGHGSCWDGDSLSMQQAWVPPQHGHRMTQKEEPEHTCSPALHVDRREEVALRGCILQATNPERRRPGSGSLDFLTGRTAGSRTLVRILLPNVTAKVAGADKNPREAEAQVHWP